MKLRNKLLAIPVLLTAAYLFWASNPNIQTPSSPVELPPKAQIQDEVKADKISTNDSFQLPEIDALLASNDACTLSRRLEAIGERHSPGELIKRLLPQGREVKNELEGVDLEALFQGRPQEGINETVTFINALLFGNFIDVPSKVIDFGKAVDLLEDLKVLDPSNGAYPFFLAALKKEQGRENQDVLEELRLAMEAPKFNTHIRRVANIIFRLGLKDHSHFMLATLLNSMLPVPDAVKAYKAADEIIAKNPELAPLALEFGKRLMREGNLKGPEHREFAHWSALEHAIGNKLFLRAWGQMNPRQGPPPYYAKSYKRFFRSSSETKIWEAVLMRNECPREKLEEIFQKEKDAFFRDENALNLLNSLI